MFEVRVSRECQESVGEVLDVEIGEVLEITFQTSSYINMCPVTSQHSAA